MQKLNLTIALLLIGSSSAWSNSIEDTHRFRLGVYDQDVDVSAAVTKDPLPEIDINFDKVLGLEESGTTAFFSYQWRFKEKWSLQGFYSQMDVDGKKVATKDFNYDGEEYTAGARLETDFGLDTYLLAVNYSLIKDARKEFGLGLGLHAFDIDSSISPAIGRDGLERASKRTNSELTAPLPNLRAYGTYMITDRWEISAAAGWLSFNYDDYDGEYLFLTVFTEYRFTQRFGIGLSYQAAEIDVSHEDSDSKEEFNIDLLGPSIYLTYGF
ncbi:MAG: hypothetical protein V7746_25215 [Halioglobus sp.]